MIEQIYDEAIDAIFAKFKAAWEAPLTGAAVIVGTSLLGSIAWQGNEKEGVQQRGKYWCRVSQQTVKEKQGTLSTCAGTPGVKRWTSTGLVFVQLFCPRTEADALAKGRRLAIVARGAFRGAAAGDSIWFRNARIIELDPENDWCRLNVVAEYEYDELG